MKTLAHLLILLLLGLISFSCSSSALEDTDSVPSTLSIESFPKEELGQEESASLQFMIEEEKLARDVYLTLNDQWNKKVFQNIAKSEQSHIDAVEVLLNRYEQPLPSTLEQIGIYENEELQHLFTTLVEQGKSSLEEALRVGALVEEVDIEDIDLLLATTIDNADISYVYEQLRKGSENHLRAFVKNLDNLGVTYEPQILDNAVYLTIIQN